MKKLYFYFVAALLVPAMSIKAQDAMTIYGDVKSNGKPVANATVIFKQSRTYATSDSLGHFRLVNRYAVDTLVITHVGFFSVIRIINEQTRFPVHIELASQTTQLAEVVVSSGYQDIPRERATGSYFKLDNQTFNQRVSGDVLSRLDGLASSVYFDNRDQTQQNIQIRGLSTLNYDNAAPLIILDNFPYAGTISNINPNDIESITVLKDAAASSIWGARAGNGVIVINTKKARANQPTSITFNSNVTYAARPNLFSANQVSIDGLIDLQKNLFANGYYDAALNDPSFPAIPQVADILNRVRNGEITTAQGDAQIAMLRQQDVRKDMMKYLYRPTINQQHYLGISGSGKSMRYSLSAGYDKNISSLRGNYADRITLRANHIIDLTKNWQIQTDALLTRTKSFNNSPGGYGTYRTGNSGLSPYSRLVNADGSPASVDLYYSRAFTDTAGNGKLLDWKYRPLQELANNNNSSRQTDILLNFGTSYRFLPWLKAELKYQFEHAWQNQDNIQNTDSYTARDYINTFSQINGNAVSYIVPKGATWNTVTGELQQQAGRAQSDIDQTWGDQHQLSAIAGAEIRSNQSTSRYGTVYGYDPNTLTSQPVDYVNLYPTYDEIYGDSYITNGNRFTQFTNRFVSVYGNASYTYGNRYTISASARRDASNIFGVATNQRWVPLWSAGLLWKIDHESFYHVNWLSQLNLRLTYGVSGNTAPNESALTRIQYYPSTRSPINVPYVGINAPPNPHLRWEQVKSFNSGIDFTIAGNRISGSLEYYTKKSVDLINSVQLDPTVGFSTANQNSASIFSKGADLTLNTANTTGAVSWRSTVLASYVNYRTVRNLNPPSTIGLVSTGTYIFPILGYNPYEIVTYKWAGLNPQTGNPRGYVNGVVSEDYAAILQNPVDQQQFIGSAVPTVFGTFRNMVSWKHFSFSVNATYRLGYYFMKPTTDFATLTGFGTGYTDYDHRWQKPGDEQHTNVPSFDYPGNTQRDQFYHYASINALKADNIKITDAYLSYDINLKHLRWIKTLQLYGYVNQLNWIIWRANHEHLDPDVIYSIKPPVTYAAGIKATF